MKTENVHDYIIIGAGPGGLQMGYYLSSSNRDYLILESEKTAGSFFQKYPVHRMLLSINKRFNFFPEKDYNLRHDWNSLLSDKDALLFKEYSTELFPSAGDLYTYLNDYANNLKLKIKYSTRIISIHRSEEKDHYILEDQSGKSYKCKVLLIGTGPVAPHIPTDIEGIEHAIGYENLTLGTHAYENKRVAIIGRGNSAFEVANHLASHAAYIHIFMSAQLKHAWDTHFVGDLRAINNTIIDMYQLKSLHSTLGHKPIKIFKRKDGVLEILSSEESPHWSTPGTNYLTLEYDFVIRCTGWRYVTNSIFDDSCQPLMDKQNKYPVLSSSWESSSNNLFFIGTSMAARDKRAASGFIHGFRYNIKSLFHILEERFQGIPFDPISFKIDQLDELSSFITKLISTSSSLYQMNGFLCVPLGFHKNTINVYQEFPIDYVLENSSSFGESVILLTLEYGFENYSPEIPATKFIYSPDRSDSSCSAFLHPIFRYYSDGKLMDQCILHDSLVVRYDLYDHPEIAVGPKENYQYAHKNKIKNFINSITKFTDEVFPENKYKTSDKKTFVPYNREHSEQCKEKQKLQKYRCKYPVYSASE